MGDRTFFRVHLYACPFGQQQAALAVLHEYDLDMELSACEDPDHDHENPQSLTLVEPYTVCEWPDFTTEALSGPGADGGRTWCVVGDVGGPLDDQARSARCLRAASGRLLG
jgi:hypothetical protein